MQLSKIQSKLLITKKKQIANLQTALMGLNDSIDENGPTYCDFCCYGKYMPDMSVKCIMADIDARHSSKCNDDRGSQEWLLNFCIPGISIGKE